MTADLTREQAREQILRTLAEAGPFSMLSDADAALTVLWPIVEGLRQERDDAVEIRSWLIRRNAQLSYELDHAHTVIARHVEPKRGAVIDRHCCATCETKFLDAEVERTGNPTLRFLRFMVVCSACGSKRCPRAADHDLACEADPRGEGDL